MEAADVQGLRGARADRGRADRCRRGGRMTAVMERLRRLVAPAGQALAAQVVMFGMVGVVNLAVDFGVFLLALRFVTTSLVVANLLAWLIAVSGSYVLNTVLTFARQTGRRLGARAYLTFAASQVLGFIANTATLVIAATVLPVIGAKAVATLVGFVVNFTLARLVLSRADKDH